MKKFGKMVVQFGRKVAVVGKKVVAGVVAAAALAVGSGVQAQTNITDAASLATYAEGQMSGVTSSFWGYAALGLGVFFAGIMITIMKRGVSKGTGR